MYFAASILFFLAAKSEATADPAMVAAAALPGSWNDTVCWKASYGRGAGRPLHTCAPDQQKSGALCYKPCDNTTTPAFKGVGPVCWQGCKPDYKDEGALCRHRNSIKTYAKKTYGRGVGHILQCRWRGKKRLIVLPSMQAWICWSWTCVLARLPSQEPNRRRSSLLSR